MKALLLGFIISSSYLNSYSQSLHLDLYGGIANYQGDIQTKTLDLDQAKPAVGLGLSYELSNRFIIRGAASYMKLTASDQKTSETAKNTFFRNLNFTSDILEAQLALEYNLLDIEERGFSPYVFAGIAAFHFNPYTSDPSGKKYF